MDNRVKTDAARQRLPLQRMMTERGDGPSEGGTWKNFKCPWCGNKSAGLFKGNGGSELFKCHHQPCPTGNESWDEGGYLAFKLNVSRKEGWVAWLKEAGVWEERERVAPSVMPGKAGRKRALPEEKDLGPQDEGLVREVMEWVKGRSQELGVRSQNGEGMPTVAEVEERFELGSDLALAVFNEVNARLAAEKAKGNGGNDNVTLGGELSPCMPPDRADAGADVPSGAEVGSVSLPEQPQEEPAATDLQHRVGPEVGASEENESVEADAPPVSVPDEVKVKPRTAEAAWIQLWKSLPLTGAAIEMLGVKRGFTLAECATYGFRSSVPSNEELIAALRNEYSDDLLLGMRVLTQKDGEMPKVNARLRGFGVAGWARNARSGRKEMVYDWVNPVLIPYWNGSALVGLRPHKDYLGAGEAARLFVATNPESKKRVYKTVMLTEGEFKAVAAHIGLGGEVACVAVPGISMVDGRTGTYELMQEFWEYCRHVGAERVVVVFDNEEKGDPKLPGYKADKRKRYDTQIWSRYLAICAEQRGLEARVGCLPDVWRDETGKIDWDGALARLRREGRSAEEVRDLFHGVLRAAKKPKEFAQMGFAFDEEEIINAAVARKFWKPLLASGGMAESKIADKLRKFVKFHVDSDGHAQESGLAAMLANAYAGTVGGYYIFKPLIVDVKDRKLWQKKGVEAVEEAMASTGDAKRKANERKWLIDKVLEGVPKRFTNFTMVPKYTIRRASDGQVDRVVTLVNDQNERRDAVLPPKNFAQPSDFKCWLLGNGNYKWGEGTKELDALTEDVCRDLAHSTVNEVAQFGWHAPTGLWFADDCAIGPNGFLLPDEEGIIWHEGQGYVVGETDREGEGFTQSRPKWMPERGLHLADEGHDGFCLKAGADNPEALRVLFQNLSVASRDTVGGYEGYMAIGSLLSFAVAPELFARNKWFPGLFVHGEKGSGKSTYAGWLMRIWGFDLENGIKLTESTKVGMHIAMQQYCNIPLWFEEFQHSLEKFKVEALKSMYNREAAIKKEGGEGRRRIMTNAVVCGEATSTDAATRSRFVHMQVSEARRKENYYDWFMDQAKYFFTLGRAVLLRRKEFLDRFMVHWKAWQGFAELKASDERSKLVHGIPYAGYMAASELFGSKLNVDVFRGGMVTHTVRAVGEVKQEVNANVVWGAVIGAFKAGALGRGGELKRWFKVQKREDSLGHPPGKPEQNNPEWWSYYLFMDPDVFSEVRRWLSLMRDTLPLGRNDIRNQFAAYPYFVKGEHKQRFGSARSVIRVWCIDVDLHPLGYQECSDEEVLEAKRKVMLGDFVDPRKGDLFLIIDAVEKADRQEENGE